MRVCVCVSFLSLTGHGVSCLAAATRRCRGPGNGSGDPDLSQQGSERGTKLAANLKVWIKKKKQQNMRMLAG